ncbi:MAG: hypothetical protein AB7P07_13820 [Hyphomonadaceae bacterium]
MRSFLFAAVMALAAPAFALEPAELAGRWETEWSNGADQPISGGAPMTITLENEDTLDGLWPSPGADGVINGQVTEEGDVLVWSGPWVSVWPEGVTRGTFRFVFADANNFTGVWSSDDGEVAGAAWNGRRIDE